MLIGVRLGEVYAEVQTADGYPPYQRLPIYSVKYNCRHYTVLYEAAEMLFQGEKIS